MWRNEKMNRLFFGLLAVALTAAFVPKSAGQGPGYRPSAYPTVYPTQQPIQNPAHYPAQPAIYLHANPATAYPAVTTPIAPGYVQPAGCSTCGPAPSFAAPMYGGPVHDGQMYGGEVMYGDAGVPCDGSCDGACGGGCEGACGDGAGWLGGHCGLFGGYNGQHCGKLNGPYGSGGNCLPRWYDVHAEWLFWKRDFDESLSFSSAGILGPDALNANQLDLSEESGFRVTGAYLLGVATSMEFTYFGALNWASGAQASSPDGALFSVFSDFGSNPLNGFPETDFGTLHQIALSSELDNGEINVRHRWVSANCLVHSSMLAGARYFRLREDLIYATQTDLGAMNYKVKTDNDLVGAQVGGDLFFSISPRLKVGAEVEGGLYGTSSSQRTNMVSTNSPALREYNHDNDVAFLGEAGVIALFRATSQLTLRVGYQVLYVDGVALAVDNFNTTSPFTARNSFLDTSGDVFYHGSTLGFEWTH
jgi:hypothetical protein